MSSFNDSLNHLICEALKEDVGEGDYSTISTIPSNKKGKAILKIKESGLLAGIDVAHKIFLFLEPAVHFTQLKKDGETIQVGDIAFEVETNLHTILKCERLVLNCMQRMSGIATLTRLYVNKLNGYKTKLLDTRKTTPNFRLLEKAAVCIGGGINNRFGLYDMIMLKDNHIDYAGGIKPAIDKAFEYVQTKNPELKIEIETRNIEEVKEACQAGEGKIFRIMLDNFTPEKITKALKVIDGKFETEASGGINLNNIIEYAKTGVDFISAGSLIHQATSLDMSLKAVLI